MSLFSKRNLLAGFGAVIIVIGTLMAIWGKPAFLTPSTTVKSQVTAYLLNDKGEVNGLLLTSGDQLRFSAQTGEAVAAQIKVGDEVTTTGRAGTKSNYGREIRVAQIQANGHTIIEAKSGPKHPREPRDKRAAKDFDNRPAPVNAPAQGEAQTEPSAAQGSDTDTTKTEIAQPAAPEIFQATGTIKAHLVNGHGEVHGLILSSGEQMRFSPKVGQLIVAAEQGAETQVSIEGTGVRGTNGTVIRPSQIRVGNQTITLAR